MIALCASLASGNLEGARSGGRALREGAAVRNAMLAVALARGGHVGGEDRVPGRRRWASITHTSATITAR